MANQKKVERVICLCGQVIAGCVHGSQDAGWDKDKRNYMKKGYQVDIVSIDEFNFGKCKCETKQNGK